MRAGLCPLANQLADVVEFDGVVVGSRSYYVFASGNGEALNWEVLIFFMLTHYP